MMYDDLTTPLKLNVLLAHASIKRGYKKGAVHTPMADATKGVMSFCILFSKKEQQQQN